MGFSSFFKGAESRIVILGTNPLIPHLEQSGQLFADLLTLNRGLSLTVLCESDFENFGQSLCVDTDLSDNRISYARLSTHRERIVGRRKGGGGLADEVARRVPDGDPDGVLQRIAVKQVNQRLPVSLILADDRLWMCVVTYAMPTVDSYVELEAGHPLRQPLETHLDRTLEPLAGGKYLSKPGEELIELYDKDNYPRGVFPRACFYTTEFQRYSVWGFIFNRRGEVLLHQRSATTKDGRGLWDKSIGGHVDLRDSSTYITARRELVEELFLPEAEFTKYMREDLGDIINFGDWNLAKRPEGAFRAELAGLDESDWVVFRATGSDGEPLTVTRVSERRMHDDEGAIEYKLTVFRSDVYLFIAPPARLDTHDQMKDLVALSEETGAAQDHRLVSIPELRAWIEQEEADGRHREVFTDDLLYVNLELRGLLERFAEFVEYVV